MKKTLITIILILPLLLSGCASIFTKSTSNVSINSDPEGAKLTIVDRSGQEIYSGRTPATVKLSNSSSYMKGENFTLVFSKPGYEDQKVQLSSKIEGWYWGNILIGGLLGFLVIDPLTGAMYKLERDYVNVTLNENNVAESTLQVIDINTLSDSQKKNLVKIN